MTEQVEMSVPFSTVWQEVFEVSLTQNGCLAEI